MKPVSLTVKVNKSGGQPQFSVLENQIEFEKNLFKFNSITQSPLSDSIFQKLLSLSTTMVLLGDSYQAADSTLEEVLEFARSLNQAFISVMHINKNRSYVDALSPDQSRKFIRQFPLTRLAKKAKLDLELVEKILNSSETSQSTHQDLPRQRTCSVITIYHNAQALTIVNLAGAERLNTFCRLNNASTSGISSQGLLTGFIFDIIPISNTRYYLHLNMTGEQESIGTLLNIFGNLCRRSSTTDALEAAKYKGSVMSSSAPNYARPTKSSIAPKSKALSVYQISKLTIVPGLKYQKILPRVAANITKKLNEKSLNRKLDNEDISVLKRQYSLKVLDLKAEVLRLRACSKSLISNISLAKDRIAVVEQGESSRQSGFVEKLEILQKNVALLTQEKQTLTDLLKEQMLFSKREAQRYASQLSDATIAKAQTDLDLKTTQDRVVEVSKQLETLEQEKISIESKYQILLNSEKSLQNEVAKLRAQADSSVSLQDLQILRDEKSCLASTINDMKRNEIIQNERQMSLESGIASLKKCFDSKCQEFDSLLKYKSKAQELELANVVLRKELQDAKAQISRDSRLSDQVTLGPANDDVSKIFGYPDVDFANITSSFSPITGFEQLSQIEFPSILKKPLPGIVSSPNRVLRQSNIRLNVPPVGKLASSPIRKDLRSWEDIENQQ